MAAVEAAAAGRTQDDPNSLKPLGIVVPHALKQRIHEGKFVDFALLLRQSFDEEQEQDYSYVSNDTGRMIPRKQLKQKGSSFTMEQRTSAFLVYISVYLEHKPNCIQDPLL